MRTAKNTLRYLKATIDLGIEYSDTDTSQDILPIGYCDASFDSDPDDSKSTSGQVFMLANGAISHRSNKQDCIAMFTMESEYMAMSEATKEAKFLINLLESLHLLK